MSVSDWDIKSYERGAEAEWNDFVAQSRQGTFLLDRRYMDYHCDRFHDHSVMVYRKQRLFALLPANAIDTTLYSHQGLTYGGLLTRTNATTAEVCEAFEAINNHLKHEGFRKVVYKAIPWIYHKIPAEEDLYALVNVCHAQLTTRDISSTIDLRYRLSFTESRKSGLRKALREGITVTESDDLAAFWNILNSNLQHKYGATPVHTLEELQLLHSRFPEQIRLLMAFQGEKPLGGTLLYITPQVVHTQYISASPEGKRVGALDALFDYIINKVEWNRPWFDFGKSTEDHGRTLNAPLIFQKEGFGGRGVCYDWYEYQL